MNTIDQAQQAIIALQTAELKEGNELDQKISDARYALFSLTCGLEHPDLNPESRPANESEANTYRELIKTGDSAIGRVVDALEKKNKSDFVQKHRDLLVLLLDQTKPLSDIIIQFPEKTPDSVDLALGELWIAGLIDYRDRVIDGVSVRLIEITEQGRFATRNNFPETRTAEIISTDAEKTVELV